jgi:L-arabinose isomerase
VPEVSNAFERAGIKFRFVSGMLGLDKTPNISLTDEITNERAEAKRAWNEIEEYVRAASVKHILQNSRFGFLGNYYSGMLDMYSDFTQIQAAVGLHIKILEMCDLDEQMKLVTESEVSKKREEIESMFIISGDSAADSIARKPSEEQLTWSCKVAAAQERLVRKFDLDALTYYYHGAHENKYEKLQSGFIVGHSLLTAKGIPCAGEADIKTNLAMKICDILGRGGSYCEIVVPDYQDGTILLGHDGPFHIRIAEGKPILRGMGLYHGKQGSGVSVEAKVKKGPITTLGITQLANGSLKMIISEAESTDGPIMQIGNTQTPVKFNTDVDSYMEKWFQESPTHHFAMSVGHNASLFKKTADILGINAVVI